MKKFLKIPAYPGLCGVVRNEGKFSQINVHSAFCWFVGIGEKFSVALAKSLRMALKVLRGKFSPERNKPAANSRIVSKQTTQHSFLELYRKVSYPDICKTPSKYKPIEDTIRDKILPTRWMKYIKNSG